MSGITLSMLAGERDMAVNVIERAVRLNPNSAYAWMASGWASGFWGQVEPAIEALERANRLSPMDPLGYIISAGLAFAHMAARQYHEAVEWADRSLRDLPRFTPAMRVKVVSYAHLGRIEEARECLRGLLEVQPGMTIAWWKAYAAVFLVAGTAGGVCERPAQGQLPEK